MGKYTAAGLFCGAGGLDMGFHMAGFDTVWANDSDRDACETHRAWSGADVVCGTVKDIGPGDVPDTDVILGGFPCQGFSFSGPRKIDDSRNTLYRHFVRIVDAKRPAAFAAENVKGLLSMGGGAVFRKVVADFGACGYDVAFSLVNAAGYGAPQDRERVIITGFRKDLGVADFALPGPSEERVTLRDAIGSFPEPDPDEVCRQPFSSRYMSRNRKRGWDEVSYTIPAMAKQVPLWPGSPDMVRLGRDLWRFGDGETRRLSWREAAAVQTFPEGMAFSGSLTSIYRQVGNAVPVALAAAAGRAVREALEGASL